MGDEVTGGLRKLRNGKLYNLYCSHNTCLIKSRRMQHARGRSEMHKEFSWTTGREGNRLGDHDLDKMMILKWFLREQGARL
jgi:hypothetical protein